MACEDHANMLEFQNGMTFYIEAPDDINCVPPVT